MFAFGIDDIARWRQLLGVLALLWTVASPAAAQTIGTFRWQLSPFCNVLTLRVSASGPVFSMIGTDDQCGQTPPASATGVASLNPDGTVTIGLTLVEAPSASPMYLYATISFPSLGGQWRDSAEATGSFVATTGPATSGQRRPAGGRIGAGPFNTNEIQRRLSGACSAGSVITSIGRSGDVSCQTLQAGTVTSVTATGGLDGFVPSGSGTIGLARTPAGAFNLSDPNGFVAVSATLADGTMPVGGGGRRLMWVPSKGAFRAGEVTGTQWDSDNAGRLSVAFGQNAVADGIASIAAGLLASATGTNSVAFGINTDASGNAAVAMGLNTRASGNQAVAIGRTAAAFGNNSFALGSSSQAVGERSFVFGDQSSTLSVGSANFASFLVRVFGGVRFYSSADLSTSAGLAPGSGTWSSLSDVNVKTGFTAIDGRQLLARLARVPVDQWRYRGAAAGIRHLGPTAQDFHAAFGVGSSDRRIGMVDADGVALAAAQELDRWTRALIAEREALEQEYRDLLERIARIEDSRRAGQGGRR